MPNTTPTDLGGPQHQKAFYTPVFTMKSSENGVNYVVFTTLSFAVSTSHQAMIVGQLANLCGFVNALELKWDLRWIRITMDAGPFVFLTLSKSGCVPRIRAAIIRGPLLDQAIATQQSLFDKPSQCSQPASVFSYYQ